MMISARVQLKHCYGVLVRAAPVRKRSCSWTPSPLNRFLTGAALIIAIFASATGCQQPVRDLFDPNAIAAKASSESYDVSKLDAVLREFVRDGRIDYHRLIEKPNDLEAFLDHIAFFGPLTQPDQFPTIQNQTAYYLNAYNACAIAAVLAEKIPTTMYDIDRAPLDHAYRVRVDGRVVTLSRIREWAREAAGDDARIEFAMCDAANGSPPMRNQAYRAELLARQLIRLAQDSLANPQLIRVDHEKHHLYVGMAIWSRRQAFIDTYKRETGSDSGTLLNCLMHLATSNRREYLSGAVGYDIRLLPFDRNLNSLRAPS